jgi:hypothetical protein
MYLKNVPIERIFLGLYTLAVIHIPAPAESGTVSPEAEYFGRLFGTG